MKVGIVGLGLSAKHFHIPLLQCFRHVDITSVMTTKEVCVVEELISSPVQIFRNFDDFVEQADCELVIVLTPNQHHFAMADTLLANGRHVLVDKPLATNMEQLVQLQQRQSDSGKVLAVFHNRRFDSDFQTVKAVLHEQQIGALSYFESRFDKYRPDVWGKWREQDINGSGLLFDIGSHLIDQMLFLFGRPDSLFADVRISRKDACIDDYFSILCFYQHFRVQLRTSSLAASTPFRFYLEGDSGTLIQHGYDSQESALMKGLHSFDNEQWLKESQENWCSLITKSQHQKVTPATGDYRQFYEQLFNAIEHSHQDYIGVKAAIAVQEIIDAAQLSSREGVRIQLSQDEKH